MQAIGNFDDATITPGADCSTNGGDYCVSLMTADGTVVTTDAIAYRSSDSHVTISYTLPVGSPQPVLAYLGRKRPDTPYSIAPAKVLDTSTSRRLVLTGDFCQAHIKEGKPVCTSTLWDASGSPTASPQVKGYVYRADGSGYTPITVHQLLPGSADVEYIADPSLHPSWLVLQRLDDDKRASQTFSYVQATPNVTTDVVYLATGLNELRNPSAKAKDNSSPPPPLLCDNDHLPTLQSVMTSGSSNITILSICGDLLFTRIIHIKTE